MPIAQLSSPLLADQAADFNFVVTWTDANNNPVDLSGWSARFAWQPNAGGSTPSDLTSGSGLTLGADGTITGLVVAATTASWSFSSPLGFELFVTSPTGAVDVLLVGQVSCNGSFQ